MLEVLRDRAADGGPMLGEDETILHQEAASYHTDDGTGYGTGRLYVTQRRAIWLSGSDESVGYAVPFLSISLHAICRDLEAVPGPCVYCQLGEQEDVNEVMFVPEDEAKVEALFRVFCDGIVANPVLDDEEEGEEEDGLVYNHDEVELGARQAMMMDRFDAMLQVPDELAVPEYQDGQFDDATQEAAAAAAVAASVLDAAANGTAANGTAASGTDGRDVDKSV